MDATMSQPRVSGKDRPDNPPSGEGPAALAGIEGFRGAIEAGQLGMWTWEVPAGRLTWSTQVEDVHGSFKGACDGSFAFSEQDLPQEKTGVFATIAECLRSHQPFRLEFRLPPTPEQDERWIEASTAVVLKDGKPVQLIGYCRDITERLRVNREVHVRSRQQEMLARLGERALVESRLQTFFDEVVATVADILDVELVKILELLPGDNELLLRAGVGWREGSVGTAHESTGRASQAGYALAAGRAVIVDDLASETRFNGPKLLLDHGVVSGVSTPIAGQDGRAYGVIGAHMTKRRRFNDYDVSFLTAVANVVAGAIQRHQLDQRQELMIRELRHRSGNLFSQLLALFSQTAKNSRNIPELVTKYEARVLALANAHRLITEGGWKSTSLTELFNTLLAPYLGRIRFAGPDVFLEPDPTFGLGMAVHELATNASKHGSLSEPRGRVDVGWSVARTAQGLTLILDWKEIGGPVPKKNRRPGFGSRLINMVIERQLNGQVHQAFTPSGLEAKLTVPLTHERWPGGIARKEPAFP